MNSVGTTITSVNNADATDGTTSTKTFPTECTRLGADLLQMAFKGAWFPSQGQGRDDKKTFAA